MMAKGLKGRSSVDLGREDDDMTDVARGNNNVLQHNEVSYKNIHNEVQAGSDHDTGSGVGGPPEP